jgi:hypothetical protein
MERTHLHEVLLVLECSRAGATSAWTAALGLGGARLARASELGGAMRAVAEPQGMPGMHRHTLQNQRQVVYIYYII